MKYFFLSFLAILAAIYIFLVLAVNDDKRWFLKFSQRARKKLSDTLKFGSLKHNGQRLNLVDALKGDCFWDRTNERGVIGGLNSCYEFLPNGQCVFYYYKFYNHKKADSVFRFEDNDVIVPTTWSAKGDTLLIARGTHYKVMSFDKDCVIVEGYSKDTMILRKNCQTILEE